MIKKERPAKRLYSIKDAAVYLGRSVCAVREMIWAGKLPYIKTAGEYCLILTTWTSGSRGTRPDLLINFLIWGEDEDIDHQGSIGAA